MIENAINRRVEEQGGENCFTTNTCNVKIFAIESVLGNII